MEVQTDFSSWKRKAAFFFTSQTISLFGSSLVDFAIIWYISLTTNSGVMMTLVTLCSFGPRVLISLFSGVWADRFHRKRMIMLADGMIAFSTLILSILFMRGFQSNALLMLICAIRSLGSGIQVPAVNAIIPQIVPPDKLMRMNGINGTIQSMVNLVAPAVGGALLTAGPLHNLMMIDVVTAAIGISLLALIRIPLHAKAMQTADQKPDYFSDLREGVQYAANQPFIRKLMGFYASFCILIVPAAFLNPLYVRRVFGETYWHLTMNEMAFFIGALLGGVLISTWGGFKNRVVSMLIGCAIAGVLTFAIGFQTNFVVYLVLMVLTGISVPITNTPMMVMFQEKIDQGMQGRVFSLVQIVGSTLMPLGMLLFGPLADIMPIQWLMISTGILMVILGIALMFRKGLMQEGIPPCQ